MRVRYEFKICVDTDEPSSFELDPYKLGKAISDKIKSVVIDGKVVKLSNILVEHVAPEGTIGFAAGGIATPPKNPGYRVTAHKAGPWRYLKDIVI